MRLDKVDVEILRLLVEDPRNVSALARRLGLPIETVRYRVKRLMRDRLIRVFAAPNYARLGLSALWVFIKARQGRTLEELLDSHPYVSYLSRCYGHISGYLVNLLAPRSSEDLALNYLDYLKSEGYIKGYLAIPSPATIYPLPDFSRYYDHGNGTWRYSWDPLLKCASPSRERVIPLPKQVLLDKIDIEIIRRLQVNATMSLTELALRLGLSVGCLRYHFIHHVISRGLITYAVEYLPYPGVPLSVLMLKLADRAHLRNLMQAAGGLPPVIGLAPSPQFNALILLLQSPLADKLNLYEVLESLIEKGVVTGYFEVVLDPKYVKKYTIPGPEYYRDGRWIPVSIGQEVKV